MIVIAVFVAMFVSAEMDAIQEFEKHSNHSHSYAFVGPTICETGLRESGYTMSVADIVFLKQHNEDGSVGEVCQD